MSIDSLGEIKRKLCAVIGFSMEELDCMLSQYGITISEPISVHKPNHEQLFNELQQQLEWHDLHHCDITGVGEHISKHRKSQAFKARQVAKRRKKNKNKKTHRR